MDSNYLQQLWEWTNSQDPTFSERYTFESWASKLSSDENYRSQFHGWISGIDPSFNDRRPINVFTNLVSDPSKKKEDSASQLGQEPISSGIQEMEPPTRSAFSRDEKIAFTNITRDILTDIDKGDAGAVKQKYDELISTYQGYDDPIIKEELRALRGAAKNKNIDLGTGLKVEEKQPEVQFTGVPTDGIEAGMGPVTDEEFSKRVIEDAGKNLYDKVEVTGDDLWTVPTFEQQDTFGQLEWKKESARNLQEKYGDYGITFIANENVYLGGDISVVSDDGRRIEINVTDRGILQEESDKLKKFIYSVSAGEKKRDFTPQELLFYSKREDFQNISKEQYDRVFTDENIQIASEYIREKNSAIASSIKAADEELDTIKKAYKENPTSELASEYNEKVKLRNLKLEDMRANANFIQSAQNNIIAERQRKNLESTNWGVAGSEMLLDNIKAVAKGGVYIFHGMAEIINRGLNFGDVEGAQEYIRKEEKFWKDLIDEKINPLYIGKATEEYWEDASLAKTALLNTTAMLPAFLVPGQMLGFFAMGYGTRMEEYENDPKMQEMMSLEEARLFNAVKAGVEARLENLGLTQALSRSGLSNSLLVKSLKQWSEKTGAAGLNRILNAEINNLVVKGGLNTAGAFIVETETGALQNFAETSLNQAYNEAKSKNVFNQPKLFTKEWIENLRKDAILEGLGGMWMGGVVNMTRYANEGIVGKTTTNEEYERVKQILDDKVTISLLNNHLNVEVLFKRMTRENADAILGSYRNAQSIVESMPEDLPVENQRKAFDLIREKQKLEKNIEGKDENLVARQRKRITEINNELQNLSENAVQEQTTSEVPVQPEATVGEEMAEGAPQAEPQVATQEGVQEEVVEPQVTTEEVQEEVAEPATDELQQEVSDLETALKQTTGATNQFQVAEEIESDELSKASGSTQVATTRGSYIKAARKISDIEGDVLDYGAGLGIGTDAMSEVFGRDVESLEINPERWKGKKPVNYTNSNQIDKKFDGIVSLNVVNVVPKEVRDFIVRDIFSKLNVGGKAVISSRGFKDDIERSKNFEVGPEDKSYIVKKKKEGKIIDVYQKGFDGNELVDYVKEVLGDNIEVTKISLGKSGVIIKKIKEDSNIQPSLSVKSERIISEETQQRIADNMSEYKGAKKIYDVKDTKGDKSKRYKIDVVQNKDLVSKVPRVSLDILKGKRVNFVVLDKAMYNKNKGMTSGVFGALSDEYFGKIAHSVGLKAQAEAIAEASSKADYTVGIIMGNAGIDSNIYMYRDLVRQVKATGKESKYFDMFKKRVKGLSIPPASKKIVMQSTSFDDLDTKYKQLGSETARKIIQGVMPKRATKNPKVPIYQALAKEQIFLEDTRFSNEEKATMNIPSGSPFIIMELQDYSGNKITEKTKGQAIIDDEIRQEEGIKEDDNYSYMLRGSVTGVFEETTPVYNIVPELSEEYVEGPRTGEKKIVRKAKITTPDKLSRSNYIFRPYEASVGEGVRLAIRKLDKGLKALYDVDTEAVDPYTSFMSTLSTAFPSINVVTDKMQFEERKRSLKEFSLMSKNQKVYGFVDGETGSIYLNPTLENYNTPVHEYGHVWLNVAKHARPDLYNKGLNLVKDTEYYERVKNSKQYQKLSETMNEEQREEYIRNEALATAIGDRGEAFVKESKNQFKEFKSWMTQLFDYIKSLVGLSKYTADQVQNLTMDEFLDGVVVDLLSGNKIFAEQQSKNLISDLQLMTGKDINQNSLYEVVQKSRDLGFGDQAIKIVLQKQGYKVAEINKAMSVPLNIMSDIPMAFGNVPGGMIKGATMYKSVIDQLSKQAKKGMTMSEIRQSAQELLAKDKTFKELNDTMQKELLISLDKSLMITENKDVAKDIRDMKRSLKDRRFAAREAQSLKTDLRNFIRANMPKANWSSAEVNKILREITDSRVHKDYYKLSKKPDNDVRTVMYKVLDMINQKNTKMYMEQIDKLMSVKEEKKVAGRIKGMFTPEGVDRVKAFKEYMSLNEKSPIDQIEQNIKNLKAEESRISQKQNQTSDDFAKLEMINTAIMYNESLLMDNKEEAKAQSLSQVVNQIRLIMAGERSEFRQTQEQKHEEYKSMQKSAIEAISGQKIDLNNQESIDEFERNIEEKKNLKDNKPRIKRMLGGFFNSFDLMIKRMESLEGLMDRITSVSTEMFEGPLNKLITERFSEAGRNYKQGKNELFQVVRENAERIYGKDYKKILERNNKEKFEIYTNKKEVDQLKKDLEKAKTKKEKRKIADKIKSKTIRYTQNEMYYHYNQYKDQANHPGYETKWKKDAADIMQQIQETLDPRVIEWADWQVNEFFPSVYDRYNNVYRKIYNTNMPWNAQYAGRLMRESEAGDIAEADLFNQMSTHYQTSIGSQSTKARVKNKRAILNANGDGVLTDYIDDMEYFRAYAEVSRDVSKIYSNDLVKKAIVSTTSEDTYNVIFGQSVKNPGLIAKIMNRDLTRTGTEGPISNVMMRNFVVSRLGLNPTIFLKQMTSAVAFADYVGYRNWSMYATKELANGVGGFNSTWKEMYENSPELQDRYDQGDFSRILENYSREAQDDFSGGVKLGKVMDFFTYLIKVGDKGGVMGSIPNYSFYKQQFKDKNPNATDQQAINFAIRKVEREIKSTQQDQDIQNKDFYQTGHWWHRWASMFKSSPRALLRKEIVATRNLYRKLTEWDSTAGQGTLKQNIRTFMTYHVAIPMFFQYVALGLPGLLTTWDDEDEESMIRSGIIGNLNAMFILGDLISGMRDYIERNPWAGDSQGLPIIELAYSVFENYTRYKDAKKESTKNKYLMKTIASFVDLTGIPGSQINKLSKNFRELLNNDYKSYKDYQEALARFFGYSDYQIKPKKKRKN